MMNTNMVAVDPDLERVLRYLAMRPEDRNPSAVRDIRERADRVRAEIRQKHGVLNVAVQLMQEARNQDDDA